MIPSIIKKEIRDAFSNRWLQVYILILALLGIIVVSFGMRQVVMNGLQMYGRTTATLINLCLLIAPLFSISLGSSSIAGEKESGTLEQLLVQPITRTELLLSKYAGLWISTLIATLAGFSPSVIFLLFYSGFQHSVYLLLFPLISQLLISVMLSIGFMISVLSKSRAQAQMVSILLWFFFVLVYDFLLIGGLSVIPSPSISTLTAFLLFNPIDSIRVLSILILEPDLYLLGPAGAYIMQTFNQTGAILMISSTLAVWILLPMTLSVFIFRLKPSGKKTKAGKLIPLMGILSLMLLLFSCSKGEKKPEKNPLLEKPSYEVELTAENSEKGKALYLINCAPCHGTGGKGDGPASAALNPKPRNHTDGAYMNKLENERIFKVIKQGGGAFGYPSMPANPQLKDEDIKYLIAFLRSIAK